MTEILPCPVLFSIGLWNTTLYLLVRVNKQRRSVYYRVHKHRRTELGMEKQTRPKSSQTSWKLSGKNREEEQSRRHDITVWRSTDCSCNTSGWRTSHLSIFSFELWFWFTALHSQTCLQGNSNVDITTYWNKRATQNLTNFAWLDR